MAKIKPEKGEVTHSLGVSGKSIEKLLKFKRKESLSRPQLICSVNQISSHFPT